MRLITIRHPGTSPKMGSFPQRAHRSCVKLPNWLNSNRLDSWSWAGSSEDGVTVCDPLRVTGRIEAPIRSEFPFPR
jgi:hypothetical protein